MTGAEIPGVFRLVKGGEAETINAREVRISGTTTGLMRGATEIVLVDGVAEDSNVKLYVLPDTNKGLSGKGYCAQYIHPEQGKWVDFPQTDPYRPEVGVVQLPGDNTSRFVRIKLEGDKLAHFKVVKVVDEMGTFQGISVEYLEGDPL